MENRTFKELQETVHAAQKLLLQLHERVLELENAPLSAEFDLLSQQWYGDNNLRAQYENHLALAQLALLYARRNDVVLARNTLSSLQSEAIAQQDSLLTGYVLSCFCVVEEYLPTKIEYAKISLRTLENASSFMFPNLSLLLLYSSLHNDIRKQEHRDLYRKILRKAKKNLAALATFYAALQDFSQKLPSLQVVNNVTVPRLPTISADELRQQQEHSAEELQQFHIDDNNQPHPASDLLTNEEYDIELYSLVNNTIIHFEQSLSDNGIQVTNDIPEEIIVRTTDRQSANIKALIQLLFAVTIPEGVISFHTESLSELTFPEIDTQLIKDYIVVIAAYMPTEGEPILHELLLPKPQEQAQAEQEEKVSHSVATAGYGAIRRILLKKGDGSKRRPIILPDAALPEQKQTVRESNINAGEQHIQRIERLPEHHNNQQQYRQVLQEIIEQQQPTEAIQTIVQLPVPQETHISRLQRDVVSALAQNDIQRVYQIINDSQTIQQRYAHTTFS